MNTKQKPTHYFVFTGHGTQTKNKLQKDFKDYLESLGGLLVDAEWLNGLKKLIIDKSIELNRKHHRCTPLNISFCDLAVRKEGYMISGYYFLTFNILAAHYASN